MKSSKQYTITSPTVGTVYHVTPVSVVKSKNKKSSTTDSTPVRESKVAGQSSFFSLKVPASDPIKFKSFGKTINLPDINLPTVSKDKTKLFTIFTGLTSEEPVVVMTSEFHSIYDKNETNRTGKSLLLKENANLVNAKSAISLMTQDDDVSQAIRENKSLLKSFIDTEDSRIMNLMRELNNALNSLDVSSFALPNRKGTSSVGSFYEMLKRGGFSEKNIVNYTETKMWQQSLIELKKSLLTHTPDLLSKKIIRIPTEAESNPFKLSDVEDPPSTILNIWLNSDYTDLPTASTITDLNGIQLNVSKFAKFHSSQYVNIPNANSPKNDLTNISTNTVAKTQGVSKNSPLVLGGDTLSTYSDSGRDISILSHMLFRESMYSSFLVDEENSTILSNRFGYVTKSNGRNREVWDYIIGKFPKSVTDFNENPIGRGNSLVSFSQNYVRSGTDSYNVLTFENNFLEGTNITPGSYYYVDSSINTANGVKFETTRLDELISRSAMAHNTTKLILDMMGYEISHIDEAVEGLNERYTRKDTREDFSLEELIERFSLVSKVYSKYLYVAQNTITDLKGGISKYGDINKDLVSVRLASVICKAAISPVESYRTKSNSLKILLFMWLSNIAIQKVEGTSNTTTISALKRSIVVVLSSISTKLSESQLKSAISEGRNFPVTLSSQSSKPSKLDLGSSNVYEDIYASLRDTILTVEGQSEEELDPEKKSSFDTYYNSMSQRLFELDPNKGLWRLIVDSMKDIYSSNRIYTSSEVTAYTGINRMSFLYSYFDLILRIISAQTPDNLLGTYDKTIIYSIDPVIVNIDGSQETNGVLKSVNPNFYVPEQKVYNSPPITVHETGLIIDRPSSSQLNGYYNATKIKSSTRDFCKRLSNAVSYIDSEEGLAVREVAIFRKYLSNLNRSLNSFRTFLNQNFESYLKDTKDLVLRDTSLSSDQKNAIVNMALTEEQLRMTRYVLSEYSDRLRDDDSTSKLKSFAAFSTFPNNFYDFLSINDTQHISCTLLNRFFSKSEFLKTKGANKKIISVGIPQKLIRTLNTSVRGSSEINKGLRQGIVRIKVWKLNKLHPDIIYQPQSFLFEMNRYPTRILSNWNLDAFSKSIINLLNIPSKVMYPDGRIVLDRDYSQSFKTADYGKFLTSQQSSEIYMNHSVSFLLEEYIRWFTGSNIDETRYYNYSPLSPEMKSVESQYRSYVNTLKSSKKTFTEFVDEDLSKPKTGYKTSTPDQRMEVIGRLRDVNMSIPVMKPTVGTNTQKTVNSMAKSNYVIPIDDTVRKYFENETLMSNLDEFKTRALYPKKFDRVFSLIIDPDDFYVDLSMTNRQTVLSLVSQGVLVQTGQSNSRDSIQFKHRDTTSRDVWLDQYFFTIEPFDYVQEYEV